MNCPEQIVVLGGGPAACVAAIALARLNYAVTVISEARPFSAVEGISQRAWQGLANAGLKHALATLLPPSPRRVSWNGETHQANVEWLIYRPAFDAALQQDLQHWGVETLTARVVATDLEQGQTDIKFSSGEQRRISADFIIEARGRAAPMAGVKRLKGPATLSLLQRWQGPALEAGSAVQSCADGWAWMAGLPDGMRYLQLTLDVNSVDLPAKKDLMAWCARRFAELSQAQPFIDQATPLDVYSRTSSAVLCQQLSGERWLRVGDAAMAVDPLSGNGVFQAVSSALQCPAVVNTLLRYPQDAAIAQQFYQQRIKGLFERFARTGRDFCRDEQQWPDAPFWQQRLGWPDDQPLHIEVNAQQVRLEHKPVIEQQRIRLAEVVTTPDQPLGIWHINGVELAPLVKVAQQSQQALADVLHQRLPPDMAQSLTLTCQQLGISA